MTEIFGALSVRKDPVSRTSTAAWQKAFPTLSAGITEATLPLFTAAGVKAQFRLNDDWMARIAKANSANPKGAQIFNPAFGVFVSERVIQCMPHEGNLLRLSRVEVVKDSVRGYVRTYNVNDAPPAKISCRGRICG